HLGLLRGPGPVPPDERSPPCRPSARRCRSGQDRIWRGMAMRRLGVIVALGALLGMFAGVLTASPALAGRGHKWQTGPAAPFTLHGSFGGFKVRVTTVVNKEYPVCAALT